MNMPLTHSYPDVHSDIPAGYSSEEWAARVDLAACYRIFAHLGWNELIYNHITLRLAGPEKHFLINPFGLMYSEVTASSLVKIDNKGNIIGHSDWPINPAGFTIHGTIHDSIPEAHCVTRGYPTQMYQGFPSIRSSIWRRAGCFHRSHAIA